MSKRPLRDDWLWQQEDTFIKFCVWVQVACVVGLGLYLVAALLWWLL